MVPDLIAKLKRRGVTFTVADDGRLKVEPKSKLRPDEIALLREHRDAVRAHVTDLAEAPTLAETASDRHDKRSHPVVDAQTSVTVAEQPPMSAGNIDEGLRGVADGLRGLSRPSGRWGGGNSEEAMQALWDAAHGL